MVITGDFRRGLDQFRTRFFQIQAGDDVSDRVGITDVELIDRRLPKHHRGIDDRGHKLYQILAAHRQELSAD